MWFFKVLRASSYMGRAYRAHDAGNLPLALFWLDAAWNLVEPLARKGSRMMDPGVMSIVMVGARTYAEIHQRMDRPEDAIPRVREARALFLESLSRTPSLRDEPLHDDWSRWSEEFLQQ